MNNLTDKREGNKIFYKMVLALVIPMALQNLINVGVTSADVIMLGKVGETVLSASSLAGQVQFVMTLIFFGLTSGAVVLTAQYWGKKDIRTIEKIMGITLRISLIVAVIFTMAVFLFPVPIMRIFTSEEVIISEGIKYLRIVAIGYVFMAFTNIYLNIMRSVERVVVSTVVYLISLIINIILNAVLIFGMFGLPAMGIQGAALATLIARLCEFAIVCFYAGKCNKMVRFHFKDLFIKDRELMSDYLIYSIPVVLNEMMWGLGTSMNTAIIGHLGSSVVAANSVAQVTRQLAMVVTFGLANAAAIVIGKAIGEKKEELAKEYSKRFIKLALLLGCMGAGVILCVSRVANNMLTLSAQAEQYLSLMMFVMAYFAIAQAYNSVLIVGIFRAGGDTKIGLILDVAALWGFAIFFGFLSAFVFKLPVALVYVILMSDEIVKIPFSTIRYRSLKWLKNVTR